MSQNSKRTTTIIIASLFMFVGVLSQSGCSISGDAESLSRRLEPLCICREGEKVEKITFVQAMAWHHAHEVDHPQKTHTPSLVQSDQKEAEHDDGLCVGVATGYQAVRYAAEMLFSGETPKASDFELSVAGYMPGVWDIFDLYTGEKLARPKAKQKKMSLDSFTFKARRVSTGRQLSFRLRDGLITQEFFDLKNSGATCDSPELERLKKQAARKILTNSPRECFELIVQTGAKAEIDD